ncbi:MAG TPA: sulfite exporter TauE/SafE family protein [Xanthobacteraceae bacterium]|nr:sulfite exporter TauE/SafE family protein [Xanthobacteraceae bacterium]
MSASLTFLIELSLVFLLAGFVKGTIGMGLPTVAIGLLTLLMAPAEAASILILPSFVTNVWQLAAGPKLRGLAHRLWPLLVAATIATVAAGRWIGAVSNPATLTALGAAIVLYAIISLMPLRLDVPVRHESWLGPLIGALTGIVTALTGVFVIPAVPYLQSLRLAPDELVQALGLSFTVSTVALAAALADAGQFHWPNAGASVLALVVSIGGMFLGQAVRARLQPKTFRFWFLTGLLLLGVHLMLRSLL